MASTSGRLGTVVFLVLALLAGPLGAQAPFIDHGVAAPVAEQRNVVAVATRDGRRIVLANVTDMGPNAFLLLTDIATGQTRQVYFPKDVPQNASFGALLTADGVYYTGQGRTMLAFDTNREEWTWYGAPAAGAAHWMAFTVDAHGIVWAAANPTCNLISFDPATKRARDHGRMDPIEQYPFSVAADSAGWIYVGIGTARMNVVAYDPRTGEKRGMVPEAERKAGSASVRALEDGRVAATVGGARSVLFQGRLVPDAKPGALSPLRGMYYGEVRGAFPDGTRVLAYSTLDRSMQVKGPGGDAARMIRFDYRSEGAMLTSLAAGPDGRVYGSSAHPMCFFAVDAASGRIVSFGPIPRIGGGNFCAITVQGRQVIGASYSDGRLWAFDPARPFAATADGKGDQNPRVLGQWERDVCRPRTALAHPDGKHVMMAGFAGYGFCGGGIGIANLETGATSLLTAERDLLPGHSCITLCALPGGNLIGGTSVDAPGGGKTTSTEAELFILDWAARKIIFHTVPVAGQRNIINLCVLPDGRVCGLAADSTFFIFDPRTREVTGRKSLAAYGAVPRHAMHVGPDGRLYALMGKSLLRFDPTTLDPVKLADSPVAISAGGALLLGRLYFIAGSHVWSYATPGP